MLTVKGYGSKSGFGRMITNLPDIEKKGMEGLEVMDSFQ